MKPFKKISMKIFNTLSLRSGLFSALFTLGFSLLSAQSERIILHAGNVLDVSTGNWMSNRSLILEDGIVKEIREGFVQSDSTHLVFDLSTKFIVPGYIDLHVHIEKEFNTKSYIENFTLREAAIAFRTQSNGLKTLKAGFTTVRDMGGTGVNTAYRDAVNEGLLKGPRIFSCGKAISSTGGHGDTSNGAKPGVFCATDFTDNVADGVPACIQAVRQQLKSGADCIKITATGGVLSVAKDGRLPQFNQDELNAICQTAKDAGVHVAAHAHGDEGMQRAVMAGVKTIEHGTWMSEKTMELMKQKGTWYIPTLTAGQAVTDSSKIEGYYPRIVAIKAAVIGPEIRSTFRKAHRKGVNIAFGTDAGVFPHGQNGHEFKLMQQEGMSNIEIIRSATIYAASVLDQEQTLGQIKPGYFADLVVINGNPLTDINELNNIHLVFKNGEPIYEN